MGKIFRPKSVVERDWEEKLPTIPYEAVVNAANAGLVNADFFEQYVGYTNWATFDKDDYPDAADESTYVIGEFFIRRTDAKSNLVLIGQLYKPVGHKTFTFMDRWIDADELAIRIEDS